VLYNPEEHHRRSIRARGYDYSSPGYYFVTVCGQHRECLYGEVVDAEMRLNDAGQMVKQWWQRLAEKFVQVDLDEHITMPNHLHGIIVILDRRRGAPVCAPSRGETDTVHLPEERVPLGEIVQWFKTMTTNEFIRGVKESGWPRFDRKLWQRDYFEHVIRDEKSLNNIRRYIRANPLMWPHDRDNPQSVQRDKPQCSRLAHQLGFTEEEFESIVSFDDDYRARSRRQGQTDVSASAGAPQL
jgi:REP element-mobilizing transposase RayT